MKKRNLLAAGLMILSLLALSGCKKEETVYLGLNAEIIEIDMENQTLCVMDLDESGVFGEECEIDCREAIEKHQVIYCNYETHDVKAISWKDLQAGDEIILELSETEVAKIAEGAMAKTNQIQLGTQRLNGSLEISA